MIVLAHTLYLFPESTSQFSKLYNLIQIIFNVALQGVTYLYRIRGLEELHMQWLLLVLELVQKQVLRRRI